MSEADGTASVVLRKNGQNEIPVTVEVFAVDGSAIGELEDTAACCTI